MKLFKKKNKEEKPSKFKEAWKDPKKKAAIKLGMWGIFISILLLTTFIASKVDPNYFQNEDNKITFKDINKMQEQLLKNNYSYEYNVTVNQNHYLFKGDKDGKRDIGYKETSDNVEKYYIENSKYYKLSLNSAIEVNNIFDGVNENYTDLVYLFNIFSSNPSESINDNVRHLVYKINDMSMTITTNQYTITKIVVEIGEDIYSLKYDNIDKIEEHVIPIIEEKSLEENDQEQIDINE